MFGASREQCLNSHIMYKLINNLTKILLETAEYPSTVMENE